MDKQYQNAFVEDWDKVGEPVWRPGVYGLIEREGRVLMVKDGRSVNKFWELPGGGMDLKESIDEALIRECKEETGYTVRPMELLTCRSHVFENRYGLYQTISIVKRIELVSEERDTSNINVGDREGEVEEMKWVDRSELSRENVVLPHHEALGL